MRTEPELTAIGLLADAHALRILHALNGDPLTAAEVVRQTKLPPAACYRRLNALLETGLVASVGSITTRNGKPARQFLANVSRVRIVYEGDHVAVNLDLRNGGTKELIVRLPEENP